MCFQQRLVPPDMYTCKLLHIYYSLDSGHSLWLLCSAVQCCAGFHRTLFRSVIRCVRSAACILAILAKPVSGSKLFFETSFFLPYFFSYSHFLWLPCPWLKIVVHADAQHEARQCSAEG